MKKVFSLLFILHIACFTAFSQSHNDSIVMMRDLVAQRTDKFLTVKGIELKPGLKMDDILKELMNKGFQKAELFDITKERLGAYLLEGPFFNRYNCSVKILPIQNNKELVSVVGIQFPDAYSFKQLKSDYDELKSALCKKYHINSCCEKFDDDYIEKSTSDNLKLSALEKDEGQFQTKFSVSDAPLSILLGQITLSISHIKTEYGKTYCYVSVCYSTSDYIIEQLKSYDDDL